MELIRDKYDFIFIDIPLILSLLNDSSSYYHSITNIRKIITRGRIIYWIL